MEPDSKDADLFVKEKPRQIMTSIFNKTTYTQNRQYIQTKAGVKYKCIYSAPLPISVEVEKGAGLFVLEMDNDANHIRGIGYIKNDAIYKLMYEDTKYHGYTYRGRYHIMRETFTEAEENIFSLLDKLCFCGRTHLKRCSGINRFPKLWIYRLFKEAKIDLVVLFEKMFADRA